MVLFEDTTRFVLPVLSLVPAEPVRELASTRVELSNARATVTEPSLNDCLSLLPMTLAIKSPTPGGGGFSGQPQGRVSHTSR